MASPKKSKHKFHPKSHPHKNLQLEVSDLSFSYHHTPVLKNISFHIEKGEYIGIIGPNGGGKSTLIKLLLGLLPSPKNSINLHSQKIGYVPQRAAQSIVNFPATVLEVIKSGYINKEPSQVVETSLKEVIKLTEIQHLTNKLISHLSGGELQKVLIARALIAKPEILILDEPIVGIDSDSQKKFYALLQKINRQHKMTILFISHDLEIIATQVTKVFCLNKTLIIHENPDDFLAEQPLIHHH